MSFDAATAQALAALDLAAYVQGDGVPLRKEGRVWKGLCPFHGEHSPSFVVYPDGRGWYCFGACKRGGSALDYVIDRAGQDRRDKDAIRDGLAALGIGPGRALTLPPLAPRRAAPKAPAVPLGDPVAIYDYCDPAGALVYQVLRYQLADGKTFRQRRPADGGGWVWNLQDVDPLLYHLPALLAADPARPVFVVEGEKDADRLIAAGLLATCNSGGAGHWPAGGAAILAGRLVVILPDADEAGARHAEIVAGELRAVGATVKIVALPGLVAHGDVSDFLDTGHTIDALEVLAAFVPADQAPVTPARIEDLPDGIKMLAEECQHLRAENERLQAEVEQERAGRLAAEAHARMMCQWGQVPNVRQGVKAVAPFVVNQYRAAVAAGNADADGWAPLNLPAIAEGQDASIPNYKERTPEQHKVVAARAEQASTYVHDMDDYGWIETRLGEWTTNAHGRHYRPLEIRPRVDLSAPLALPVPDKKTARPRKVAAICPQCHKAHTRQVVAYECLNADCRAVFTPEQADNAAELLADAPALDPEISDQKTEGLLDPEISDQAETPAAPPANAFRITRDAVWEMAQRRAAMPPTSDRFCFACDGPCTGQCEAGAFLATIPPPARARAPVEVGARG